MVFGILLKIENRHVAIDTKLNLLEGAIAVKEKVVIKIKLTIIEYRRDRNRIYICSFHMSQRHCKLSINQTEASGNM